MAKSKKKSKRDYYCHGQAFSKSGEDVYITTGEKFRVDGGTKEDHKRMVELTARTTESLNKEQPKSPQEAMEILRDVSKKVGWPEQG
jgi:hypothetical protein